MQVRRKDHDPYTSQFFLYVGLRGGQKFKVNVIKAAHRMSNFLKSLVSQEILESIGLRKICFKITQILVVENVIYIFVYNFANVVMKPEPKV